MTPQEDFEKADREYREAEALVKAGVPLPYLVTLSFATKEEAIEFIESIKKYSGVVTDIDDDELMPYAPSFKTILASVKDFHPWGGEKEWSSRSSQAGS